MENSQMSKHKLTSSQFWSSFTQNRARWKLLLSVRSRNHNNTCMLVLVNNMAPVEPVTTLDSYLGLK